MADLFTDTGSILPVVMTTSGPVVTSPVVIRETLTTLVASTNPEYTNNLPGSLIEDIASTDVGAISLIDQARVDLINSITPYGANQFLLNQLGQIYGVQRGKGSNTSVYVTFTGTPGFVISIGFTVSDGNYQYVVQDGGTVNGAGQSPALYCLANVQGSWAVPANTVTQLITSVPSGVTLNCTNQTDGLPGDTSQSDASYRAQVLQAGLSASQGSPTFIKTALQKVSGVQPRLISIRNVDVNQWQVICGGGDPYSVAHAIYTSTPDISALVGSATTARNITVSINDFPDTYNITFVNPPVQTVSVNLTWNTIGTNYVSPTAVAQAGVPAIVQYINSVYVGQPISLFELQDTFQNAVAGIIPISLISKMSFVVAINGSAVPPVPGTLLIYGDSESYFSTTEALISIVQG